MNLRQNLSDSTYMRQNKGKYQPLQEQKQKQLKIVSEYLELNHVGLEQQDLLPISCYQKQEQIQNPPKRNQIQSEEGHSKAQKAKTSLYHNFQKHLSNTLKTRIKLKKTQSHQRSQSMLANQLWQYFCLSVKSSKKFIYCLLGGDIINNSLSKKQKYSYFSEYRQEEINASQKYLCRQIIRQSRFLLEKNKFENRKINKPDQFKNYYAKFIGELQSGKMSRRLPKKSNIQSLVEKEQIKQNHIQ